MLARDRDGLGVSPGWWLQTEAQATVISGQRVFLRNDFTVRKMGPGLGPTIPACWHSLEVGPAAGPVFQTEPLPAPHDT